MRTPRPGRVRDGLPLACRLPLARRLPLALLFVAMALTSCKTLKDVKEFATGAQDPDRTQDPKASLGTGSRAGTQNTRAIPAAPVGILRAGARRAGGVRARAPFVEFAPFDGPRLTRLEAALEGKPAETIGFVVRPLAVRPPPAGLASAVAIDNAGELFALALAEELAHLGLSAALADEFEGLEVADDEAERLAIAKYLLRIAFGGEIALWVTHTARETGDYLTTASIDLQLDAQRIAKDDKESPFYSSTVAATESASGATARGANDRAKESVRKVLRSAIERVLADEKLDRKLADLVTLSAP